MTVRAVEGKKPYTGGEAITVDENKVISLNLRDENNLIIYDAGDNEIYVDLQLSDELTPTDAFPVGITTGRVIVDNGWDLQGTLICAKTTSGDNIKVLYADEGTLWIDNGTGTFKQIYFKADVDGIITTLTTYINTELAKKQNGVASTTAPSNPSEGDLWYDTINSAMKVWDGTAWQSVGTGGGGSDIVYATQAEYEALLPGAESDNKHYFIYTESGGGGWQPGANTLAYYPFKGDAENKVDTSQTATITDGTVGSDYVSLNFGKMILPLTQTLATTDAFTASIWFNLQAYRPSGITYYSSRIYGEDSRFRMIVQTYYAPQHLTLNWDTDERNNSYTAQTELNSWTNIIVTYSGSGNTIYLYKNGVKYTYPNGFDTNNSVSSFEVGHTENPDGYFADFILENVQWTDQEVADYYNQTKANYGIS